MLDYTNLNVIIQLYFIAKNNYVCVPLASNLTTVHFISKQKAPGFIAALLILNRLIFGETFIIWTAPDLHCGQETLLRILTILSVLVGKAVVSSKVHRHFRHLNFISIVSFFSLGIYPRLLTYQDISPSSVLLS